MLSSAQLNQLRPNSSIAAQASAAYYTDQQKHEVLSKNSVFWHLPLRTQIQIVFSFRLLMKNLQISYASYNRHTPMVNKNTVQYIWSLIIHNYIVQSGGNPTVLSEFIHNSNPSRYPNLRRVAKFCQAPNRQRLVAYLARHLCPSRPAPCSLPRGMETFQALSRDARQIAVHERPRLTGRQNPKPKRRRKSPRPQKAPRHLTASGRWALHYLTPSLRPPRPPRAATGLPRPGSTVRAPPPGSAPWPPAGRRPRPRPWGPTTGPSRCPRPTRRSGSRS